MALKYRIPTIAKLLTDYGANTIIDVYSVTDSIFDDTTAGIVKLLLKNEISNMKMSLAQSKIKKAN